MSSARPSASASAVAPATSSSAFAEREPVVRGEPLNLAAELDAELRLVTRNESTPVESEVGGRQRVDRAADHVRDDELAGVDRALVVLAREILHPGREREHRGVAGEVRGGTRSRLRQPAPSPVGQPGTGKPEGEYLIGVDMRMLASQLAAMRAYGRRTLRCAQAQSAAVP